MSIKFTPFGVPYILEFQNISFLPQPNSSVPDSRRSSSSESFCYIECPPPQPRSFPSFFKRKNNQDATPTTHQLTKPLPPPPPSESHDGIYIQFTSEHSHPHLSRKQRLIHLQQTISNAVLDAGMSRSPGNTSHPENCPARGHRTSDALFCGTYGQMMAALEGAGLSATPCAGDGLSGHSRLGALFVAHNNGADGVQVRKITLWG